MAEFLPLQILKDEGKRAAYDQYGAASQQPGFNPDSFSKEHPFASAFSGFQGFGTTFDLDGNSGDIFSQLFGLGTRGGRSRASKGDDIEAQVSLSFLDACKGVTRTINVSPIANCPTCAGTGIRPGARQSTCSACGGSGTKTFVIDSGFQMASTCANCDGTGYVVQVKDRCSTCSGVGKVHTRKTVNVTIPPGIVICLFRAAFQFTMLLF
jgi:molecular chaperone DnaJ